MPDPHALPPLITRGEILGGLLQRRAWNLLFMIENRSAYQKASAPRVTDHFVTAEALKRRELIYLQSFTQGKQPPVKVTIQDIEHYAMQWAFLIPETANLRAALAHQLAEKYRFERQNVVNIRASLGLDGADVQAAYQRQYGQPLETIYRRQLSPVERLGWAWHGLTQRVENLPPFWAMYALTLTEIVGAGIMALPIAIAGVGPWPGLVLLVVLGLVNLLTLAFTTEAISRSGAVRYGQAYISKIVDDLLGRGGSILVTTLTFVLVFLQIPAYLIGFGASLGALTGISPAIWAALLCAVTVYITARQLLNATVAVALLVGAVNIVIVLFLSLLNLSHFQAANLAYVNLPFWGGQPFDPSILGLIFGVVMLAYFGHLSINSVARTSIQRDPSCRSLFWGGAAAQATAIVLYLIWSFTVTAALAPQELLHESGTALVPLARQIGGLVPLLGAIFVVLSMGLGTITLAISLFGLASERLPILEAPVLSLSRRQGKICLVQKGKGGLRIDLAYLGVSSNTPQIRLDVVEGQRTHHIQVGLKDRWDLHSLRKNLSQTDLDRLRLKIEVVQVNMKSIGLRFDTNLSLSYAGEWDPTGVSVAQVLSLSEAQQKMITWMLRERRVTLSEVAAYLNADEDTAREVLALMADEGLVSECQTTAGCQYQVLLGFTRRRVLSGDDPAAAPPDQRISTGLPDWKRLVAREPLRTILALSPFGVAFLLGEISLFSGTYSFSSLLGFVGVITIPILSGVYPVLMLIAGRRKGEFVPPCVYRWLGNPLLLVLVFLINWAGLGVHAWLWQDPFERLCAIVAALLTLGMPIALWRSGMFRRRVLAMVQVHQENRWVNRVALATVASGEPLETEIHLRYPTETRTLRASAAEAPAPGELREIVFTLPTTQSDDLLLWTFRVDPSGSATALGGHALVHQKGQEASLDLSLSDGRVIIPCPTSECQVHVPLSAET